MGLVEELEATRDETLRYFALGADDLEKTYGPGKWSVKFMLHHLADSETVLNERIRRILSEPRPVLWVFDQDAWARGLDYGAMPLELSRDLYAALRNGMIHLAREFYETKGHMEWVHSVSGVRTLKQEFDKTASHNAHHLEQIRAALGHNA